MKFITNEISDLTNDYFELIIPDLFELVHKEIRRDPENCAQTIIDFKRILSAVLFAYQTKMEALCKTK